MFHRPTFSAIKFRPKTDEHDYQFKKTNIVRFLGEGDKVKATIIFRGRENYHQDIGLRILERLRTELAETGTVEVPPRKEGSLMHMIIAPRKRAAGPTTKREDKQQEPSEERS